MHGSSGADLIVNRNIVTKRGDERVGDQGRWLKMMNDLGIRSIPYVYGLTSNSYSMEMLDETEYDNDTAVKMLQGLVPIWKARDSRLLIGWDISAFITKMTRMLTTYEMHGVLEAWKKVDWTNCRIAGTHGDPTFENTMSRIGRAGYVFIDPIPATPSVPDLAVVDLGKIYQSMVGYENMRYGTENPFSLQDRITLQEFCKNDDEVLGMKFWAAVHLYRARPYMKDKGIANDLGTKAATLLRGIRH